MSIISSEQKSIVRKKIIAANWKMNLTHEDVLPYLGKFLVEVGKVDDLEIDSGTFGGFEGLSFIRGSWSPKPALGNGRGLHWRGKRRDVAGAAGQTRRHWSQRAEVVLTIQIGLLTQLELVRALVVGRSEQLTTPCTTMPPCAPFTRFGSGHRPRNPFDRHDGGDYPGRH